MSKGKRMYSGLVLGGPLDGKRVDSVCPIYKVPLFHELEAPTFEAVIPDVHKMPIVDTYCYSIYKTPGGSVWIPDQIQGGGVYEHKRYDHAMDFIFAMLIRAYRPEGY